MLLRMTADSRSTGERVSVRIRSGLHQAKHGKMNDGEHMRCARRHSLKMEKDVDDDDECYHPELAQLRIRSGTRT